MKKYISSSDVECVDEKLLLECFESAHKVFLNHIVIFIAIFMLIGGNLRSRKRDMDGQEWVFVTLVTLHIITL